MSIHAWSHLSSWILPIQVKTIEGMFWEKFNYWIYERFPWLFSFRHCRVFLSTLVPTPNCQHDLQFWILLLQSNCSFVWTLKIHSLTNFNTPQSTFCDVLLCVQWHDGQAVGLQAGKAVDEVGAGEWVDVGDTEVEWGGPVDRPGAVIANDLKILCLSG